jgi:hypothetical protein
MKQRFAVKSNAIDEINFAGLITDEVRRIIKENRCL